MQLSQLYSSIVDLVTQHDTIPMIVYQYFYYFQLAKIFLRLYSFDASRKTRVELWKLKSCVLFLFLLLCFDVIFSHHYLSFSLSLCFQGFASSELGERSGDSQIKSICLLCLGWSFVGSWSRSSLGSLTAPTAVYVPEASFWRKTVLVLR